VQLAWGEGTAWLAFSDGVVGGSEFTRVFRSTGGAFEDVGQLPAHRYFVAVMGPDFAILDDGGWGAPAMRYDGTKWVDDPLVPTKGAPVGFGYKRANGVYIDTSKSTDDPAVTVLEWSSGAWTTHLIPMLPPVKVGYGYLPYDMPRGVVSTAPGKFSLVSAKADEKGTWNVVSNPVSGDKQGSDIRLYPQQEGCESPVNCHGNLNAVKQFDDGTVVIRDTQRIFVGNPGDFD
jgi:hypothetical protein